MNVERVYIVGQLPAVRLGWSTLLALGGITIGQRQLARTLVAVGYVEGFHERQQPTLSNFPIWHRSASLSDLQGVVKGNNCVSTVASSKQTMGLS